MRQWMDGDSQHGIGDVGFIVEIHNTNNGGERFRLDDVPPHTNRSNEPTLEGWCGETDNVSIYGRGMGKVVRIARNGRMLVETLAGTELTAALETLGYPELDPC